MPLPTIPVLDGNGDPINVPVPNSGRRPDVDSQSVALSTEGIAAINAVATAVVAALQAGLTINSAPAPTGGATSALQTTGNGTLAGILAALSTSLQTELTGDAAADLSAVVSALTTGTLTTQFAEPQEISGTVDFVADGNVPVVAAGNFPVVEATAPFVFTVASGTSTGSAIAALGVNASRVAFQFQNASDTDFTVNFDGTASASAGFLVAPGKVLEFYGPAAPKGAVSIFCGASAKRYVLRHA